MENYYEVILHTPKRVTHSHNDLNSHQSDRETRFCTNCGSNLRKDRKEDHKVRTCSACGFIHYVDPKVAVAAAVVSEEGLLLVRRRYDPEKGKWSLPGGFLNADEDPREAAAREVKEETGLNVSVGELVDVFFKDQKGSADISLLFQANFLSGTIQPGDDADRADFFPLDNLPLLAFQSTQAAVNSLKRSGSEVPLQRI